MTGNDYVHWLAEVHSAVLLLHSPCHRGDSESSRKQPNAQNPEPRASGVRLLSRKNKETDLQLKNLRRTTTNN